MLVLLLICFCSFYIGFQWKVLFLLTEIEDHVKNQSTPAVNHSGDVEWLDTKCIDANHYDFSVIVTNFGPKLRCYGQQSTCYGFPIIAGPKPFPI